MLDFTKTYKLISQNGNLLKPKLISQNNQTLLVKGMLDFGLFTSIVRIEITHYGNVSICFSLGKTSNINEEYRSAELKFLWALNSYLLSNNSVFMFTTIVEQGIPYAALQFNDINVTKNNDTPEKVANVINTALYWMIDSPLSGHTKNLGIILNKKK